VGISHEEIYEEDIMSTTKSKRSTGGAIRARQRNALMGQFEKTGLLREVTTAELSLPNGNILTDKKAIVYADDDSYIATVGNRYQVIQNAEVMEKLANALAESDLNLKGASVNHSSSATCARNLIKVTLPEHNIETSKGDSTCLQILARNSYDGSWKQMLDIGGFRMACANGQVYGDIDKVCHNRHTQGYDVAMMAEYLSHAIDVFKEMGAQWLTMKKTKLTKTQAEDAILHYLGRRNLTKEDRESVLTSERATAVQSLLESWTSHKTDMGSNLFALYNTLTYHASHVDDLRNPADAQIIRGQLLTQAISPLLH